MKPLLSGTQSLTLAVLMFISLASRAEAQPAGSAQPSAPQQLPFHAAFHGNAEPFQIDQCTLGNHEKGSGLALYLGAWKWSDTETVHFVGCPASPPGSAIAVSGQFTMEAANGDEITGTFDTTGTFDPVLGVSVQGGYAFVSGTGRFVNVSGTGVIEAHGAAGPPFEFVASMNGSIRLAGP